LLPVACFLSAKRSLPSEGGQIFRPPTGALRAPEFVAVVRALGCRWVLAMSRQIDGSPVHGKHFVAMFRIKPLRRLHCWRGARVRGLKSQGTRGANHARGSLASVFP
jgi:hypothetical protein